MVTIYSNRQTEFSHKLLKNDLTAMLVFGHENIQYLTGFTGNAAYLIASHTSYTLITDYRYVNRIKQESHNCNVICRDRENEALGVCINRLITDAGLIGFDAAYVTVAMWQDITRDLKCQLQPITGLIEELRSIKDDWEVTCIRKAAEIADAALADTLELVKAGITEKQLAASLDYRMQQLGSDGVSFETILLFGTRSALPHGKPSDVQLREGDFILVDFGAVVNGYRSDMTRTYVYKTPTQEQQHMFDTVLKAHTAAVSEVCSGAECATVNDAAANIMGAGCYQKYSGKGIGHGLGLFLHEAPFITTKNKARLDTGNVITIEPGIYIPEVGGVRIEDDILVTRDGYECLTFAPKKFILE